MAKGSYPCVISAIKKNAFLISILLGIVLGIGIGLILRSYELNAVQIRYLGFPGEIIINVLKLLIVPLLAFTTMSSVASFVGLPTRIMLVSVTYFVTTSAIAALVSLLCVSVIRPGSEAIAFTTAANNVPTAPSTVPVDVFMDLFRNIFPKNMVSMALVTAVSERVEKDGETVILVKEASRENILGIICISLIIGAVLGRKAQKGSQSAQAAITVISGLSEAFISLARLVCYVVPLGVIFLFAQQVVSMTDLGMVRGLGRYFLTIAVSFVVNAYIILPIVLLVLAKQNPIRWFIMMLPAKVMAFSTASSAATIPTTLDCVLKSPSVEPEVANLIVPLGATINMDGVSQYLLISALFAAKVSQTDMSGAQIVALVALVCLLSIGCPAVPNAGVVAILVTLSTFGIPLDLLPTFVGVDLILDRVVTALNIWGDSVGTAVVSRIYRKFIRPNRNTDNDQEEEARSESDDNQELRPVSKANSTFASAAC